MGGGVDGDAEGGAGADHLLGGGDYFWVFEDCGAELFLDIAYAVRGWFRGIDWEGGVDGAYKRAGFSGMGCNG